MKKKSVLQILCLVLGLFGTQFEARAQENDTLYVELVDELLQAVIQHSPLLKILELRTMQLNEKATQVGVYPDPSATLVALPLPLFTAKGSQRVQIQFSQAIPFPGKLALREDASRWAATASKESEETLRQDLIEATRLIFADVKKVLRQSELVYHYQDILRGFESVAETRYRVGTGTQQAVLKAQLERNALSTKISDLDQSLTSKLRQLSILTDHPVEMMSNLELRWDIADIPIAANLETLAFESRSELRSLQAELARTSSLERLARKEWRPDFNVGVTYFNISAEASPPGASGRDAVALTFGVKLPIQSKRLKARLEETKLMQLALEFETALMERTIRAELGELRENAQLLIDQRNLYQGTLIPQAQTTLQSTISAYTTGEVGFLDLLDAERMLFNLTWQLENVSAQLEKTIISLDRALGV